MIDRLRRALLGSRSLEDGDDPDPRFSLANERTFLAWNRTALALISVGLAVTQLLPPFDFGGGRKLIGLPLIVLGSVVALASLREWAANEYAMRHGDRLPRSVLIVVVAAVVALVGAIAFVVAVVA